MLSPAEKGAVQQPDITFSCARTVERPMPDEEEERERGEPTLHTIYFQFSSLRARP